MYMGKDKHENEDLIKYGLPEDVWFHVENLSSAHVYLRLKKDQKLDDVSMATIEECATLTKANSIEGCKKHEVYVTYTKWKNLNKTNDMEVGAIGFKENKRCRRVKAFKNNGVVNALNKTKEESYPDLAALQMERAKEFQAEMKKQRKEQFEAEAVAKKEKEAARRLQGYGGVGEIEGLFDDPGKMKALEGTVDESAAKDFEEDFM